MIRFEQVGVTYQDAARPVLEGVDLTVPEGELCLLVGPSGVGKSTLLGTVSGLVPHFTGGTLHGRVTVDGRDTRTHKPRELADVVGTVGQDPLAHFVTDTVEDELAYGMESLGLPQEVMRRRVEETLDLLGIAALRDRPLVSLSGGQQQRVAIGSVLTPHPRVLVLDEPTSALDPGAAEEVLAVLQRLVHDLGTTVLMAEHRLERVVQYADRVLLLPARGAAPVLGDPATLMADSPVRPPVVDLGRLAGWSPLPLSVRDARRRAAPLRARLAPYAPTAGYTEPDAPTRADERGIDAPGTPTVTSEPPAPAPQPQPQAEPEPHGSLPASPRTAAAAGDRAGDRPSEEGTGDSPGGPGDALCPQADRAPASARPQRGAGVGPGARGGECGQEPGPRRGLTRFLPLLRHRRVAGAPGHGGEAVHAAVDTAVDAAGITVRRGRAEVLRRLRLTVRAGETVALMGRNGAGKSTLLRTLVGMHEPAAGTLHVGGAVPHRTRPSELLHHVGLVPQDPRDLLYADTVGAECASADHDAQAPDGTCRGLVERLLPGVPGDTHPRDLSEGQRLALALAVILTAAPPLLLLDEPTRGLDYAAKSRLVGLLRELAAAGHAIVLATHDVELAAELAHRVVILADGDLVADGPTADVVTASPAFAPQLAKVLAPQRWLTLGQVRAALDRSGGAAR